MTREITVDERSFELAEHVGIRAFIWRFGQKRGHTVTKTYDVRCYELAALFLGDEPDLHTEHNIVGLASLIQDTIEDEIAHLKEQWRAENGQFGVDA